MCTVRLFTKGPFEIYLFPQLPRHLVEAFDRICNAARRLKMFNYGVIDRRLGERKLKIIGESFSGRLPEHREVLTSTAGIRASFHELFISFAFVHSLKSGGWVVAEIISSL